MTDHNRFRVRFLISHNLPGSITRITVDTANVFARLGIPTTVMFPAVDWWDFKLFSISRTRSLGKWKSILKLAGETAVHVPFRRTWCGFRYHEVDSRVRASRFLVAPSAREWNRDEITVVHPPYLMPHLLKTVTHPGTKMVSGVYVNLEKAMNSPSSEAAAWYRHWVTFERYLSTPRYAASEEARRAAERLGISIRKVIYFGIDLRMFRPAGPPARSGPTVISLYCDPHVQKGRAVGVEALTSLKSAAPDVRLCSIGHVTPEDAIVFDHNYGFLHGEEYANALRTSDIFVYPSLYDGFPAPPLQAMASGTALVTTAVEGVSEYAVHQYNALLCEPGNAEMMRSQILALVHDHRLRERLQSNGPKTADGFSAERGAMQLLDFLEEVYEEHRIT